VAHKSVDELRTITHVSYLELLATKLHRTFTDNAYLVRLGRKSVAKLQRITHVWHWSYVWATKLRRTFTDNVYLVLLGSKSIAKLRPTSHVSYRWSCGQQTFAALSPVIKPTKAACRSGLTQTAKYNSFSAEQKPNVPIPSVTTLRSFLEPPEVKGHVHI